MLRVKIPFGRLDSNSLEALADVGDRYSRGFGHVTTRQNVQFHFIAMANAEAAMRRLDEAGLTTRDACGNSVRAVTACELAEVCQGAPFDVSPHAEAVTRQFLGHPLASTLPRKFKIAFSGCATDCAKAAIHDLGFIAKVENGEPGFRVVAAERARPPRMGARERDRARRRGDPPALPQAGQSRQPAARAPQVRAQEAR